MGKAQKIKISRAKFNKIIGDFKSETNSLSIYLAIHGRKNESEDVLRQVLERHFEIIEEKGGKSCQKNILHGKN